MRAVCTLIILVAFTSLASAQAQEPAAERTWPEEKCFRYREATSEAFSRFGKEGLSSEFLDRHDAFIAGGCTARGDVCPRSERELAFANIMTIRAMNAGTASSFPPFACRN